MSTTTIRIEDDLKARVAAAAQRAGKTAHAFILDAISQTVEQVELDNAFSTLADQRWALGHRLRRQLHHGDARRLFGGAATRPRRPRFLRHA